MNNDPLNEKVSVIMKYDRIKGTVSPVKIHWQGTDRIITKIGLHYPKRDGRKLLHIFTACDGNLTYYLSLDTETLHWTLLEVSDGVTG